MERASPPRQEVTSHAPSNWEIDRRIPLLLIITLVASVLGGAWYIRDLDNGIQDNVVRLNGHERRLEGLEETGKLTGDRLVRVETLVEQLVLTNVEIRDLLARILLQIQSLPKP